MMLSAQTSVEGSAEISSRIRGTADLPIFTMDWKLLFVIIDSGDDMNFVCARQLSYRYWNLSFSEISEASFSSTDEMYSNILWLLVVERIPLCASASEYEKDGIVIPAAGLSGIRPLESFVSRIDPKFLQI